MTEKLEQISIAEQAILDMAADCGLFFEGDIERQVDSIIDFAQSIVQAVLAKPAAEQDPVAWRVGYQVFAKKTDAEKAIRNPDLSASPLYSIPHPPPRVSSTSDKTACLSEGAENETQEPVAVVGPDFQLLYAVGKPINEIKRLKVGMGLYARPAPSAWKPIETAPHELESRILATNGVSVTTCYWSPIGWVNERSAGGALYSATHWMPLPAPPTQEADYE